MTDNNSLNEKAELLHTAHEYAWNWFDLHAKQRQQSFHFYLILISGIMGAYFFASRMSLASAEHHENAYNPGPFLISAIALVASLLFYRLDRRNRCLIRYAESAMEAYELELQKMLPESVAPNYINLASNPAQHQSGYIPGLTTYGDIYRVIFGIGALAGLVGLKTSWPPQGIGRLLNSMFI